MSKDAGISSSDQAGEEVDDASLSLDQNIADWMESLRKGDGQAQRAMWQSYFGELVALARRRLAQLPRREMDEEDVALSAMYSFHRGLAANRFPQLTDRQDLWRILVTITLRKVVSQRRRHFAKKRGGGRVRGESLFQQHDAEGEQFGGIDQLLGAQPSPEFISAFAERCQLLFGKLDDLLRPVALLKVEGYTNLEIADRLDLALRTVERRLGTIRGIWAQTMASLDDNPNPTPPD